VEIAASCFFGGGWGVGAGLQNAATSALLTSSFEASPVSPPGFCLTPGGMMVVMLSEFDFGGLLLHPGPEADAAVQRHDAQEDPELCQERPGQAHHD